MYTITRFGTVTLPIYETEYTISPVPSDMSGLLPVGSNVFDGNGSDRAPLKFPAAIVYKCIAHESTLGATRVATDALRALVGRRDYLYRVADDDATVQQCLARLAGIDMPRGITNRIFFEMNFKFVQLAGWRGNSHGDWRFDSGEIFDDGLTLDSSDFQGTFVAASHALVVTNAGNLPIQDAILTITAGSGTITSVAVAAVGASIDWRVNATLTPSATLVVDCATRSVTVNGDDAYRDFALGSGHRLRNWLYLEPGNTTIVATLTGTFTGAKVSISFRDAWA